MWELIARPTLNLLPADASLAQAAYVFQQGLLTDAAAGDVGYARVPLGEIHDRAARRASPQAGVEVRLRHGATAIALGADGFRVELSGVPSRHGRRRDPRRSPRPRRAAASAGRGLDRARLAALGTSPIVNLHVVYDRPVLEHHFAASVRTPVQWVFDRTEGAGLERGQYLAISLSAADAELNSTVDDLRARFLRALAELLPAAREAQVETFFVTREHAATFRAAPGARALRPGPSTEIPGLLLAGAWTDTGWPATMEGAVRSGAGSGAPHWPRRPAAPRSERWRRERSHRPRADVRRGAGRPGRCLLGARAPDRNGTPERRAQCTGGGGAVLIAGFCGALDPELEPGDVVLASELRGPTGTTPCPDPSILAGVLRRGGLRVRVGPIASSQRLVVRERRRVLQRTGALAVDMESAWLAPATHAQPLVTLRVVLDTHRQELHRPLRTVAGAAVAYRTLRRASALAESWAAALGPREVVLASPRASCAGVVRAVEIVERALADRGAPIYVRKQIVHNAHVVADLEQRGAIFVDEVDEVPLGATVIFSAHGVSPAVRAAAEKRRLDVIDATCPLVAKVHAEARRFAGSGFDIVLVGHEGHEEVEGTFGEAPAQIARDRHRRRRPAACRWRIPIASPT